MLAEVDQRSRNGEEFALAAWSPYWMNQRYGLKFLEYPEDAFGELPQDDPGATEFMDALVLDEEQGGDLESAINEAANPYEGAKR